MATLYYNAAVDNDWATLGNWWTDSGFTTPASSLPTSVDNVKIYGNIYSNAGSTPTVNSLGVYGNSNYGISINVTCVTFCEFIDESYLSPGSTVTAPSGIFGGDSVGNGYVAGTFNGTAYLYGSSSLDSGGIINGTAYFYNTTKIMFGGTLNGSGIFDIGSLPGGNYGTINGNASGVFVNYNSAYINGNAIFLGSSSYGNSPYGTVNGSGTFYNDTFNFGTINFAATFYNTAHNAGTIGTNATFNNNSYHYSDFGFSLYGSVYGNATFNNSSYNDGGYVAGPVTFNNTSFNAGYINGPVTFNNSSYNSLSYYVGNLAGKCNNGATYNHDSYQESGSEGAPGQYVPFTNGTATFRDRSINKGQCPGTVVFAHGKGVNGSSILGIV